MIFLLVICVTGQPLLFSIGHWLDSTAYGVLSRDAPSVSLDNLARTSRSIYP